MKLQIKLMVGCLTFATPRAAYADSVMAVTPSGAAETVFAATPRDSVAKLSGRCIDAKFVVISSSESELVCEAPLNMGQSIMGQLLMGNSYSTPPRRFLRFNAAQVGQVTRVQGSGWIELQMAFGQTRRTDLSGADFQNSMLGFMTTAGGQLPVGTRFPNHVLMGTRGEAGAAGYRITEVDQESPAGNAGLKVGDVITKIAGKRIKNQASMMDGLAKAAKTAMYPVEVYQGGKLVSIQLIRAFRPAISEIKELDAPPKAGTMGAVTVALSTADELAKFAKLRSDGVITEAEFEEQKKKLLGR